MITTKKPAIKRLGELTEATMTDAQKLLYDKIASGPRKGVRGPLAVWLHNVELAECAQRLGQYCRYETRLQKNWKEMVILTVGAFWRSRYELEAHVPFALEAGVSQSVIDAILSGARTLPGTDAEAEIYAATLEMLETRSLGLDAYQGLVKLLGESAVVDLVAIIGYYAFVSLTINVFEVVPSGE